MFSTWYGLQRFKRLNKRTAADKVLHHKAVDIAKNPKYDGYQSVLFSVVYKFVDRISSGGYLYQICMGKITFNLFYLN